MRAIVEGGAMVPVEMPSDATAVCAGVKRSLFVWQKSPRNDAKETYYYDGQACGASHCEGPLAQDVLCRNCGTVLTKATHF